MHGIVIIEIYSNNKKVNTLHTVVTSPSYILPKCTKTREPKDEHCVPLDNLKNHKALPYITWGAHPGFQN